MADEQRAVPVLEFGEILNPAISDLLIASVLYWPRGDQNRLGLKEHCFVCWTGELVNDSGNTYSNLSVENRLSKITWFDYNSTMPRGSDTWFIPMQTNNTLSVFKET